MASLVAALEDVLLETLLAATTAQKLLLAHGYTEVSRLRGTGGGELLA